MGSTSRLASANISCWLSRRSRRQWWWQWCGNISSCQSFHIARSKRVSSAKRFPSSLLLSLTKSELEIINLECPTQLEQHLQLSHQIAVGAHGGPNSAWGSGNNHCSINWQLKLEGICADLKGSISIAQATNKVTSSRKWWINWWATYFTSRSHN